jgi:hypothetical protein
MTADELKQQAAICARRVWNMIESGEYDRLNDFDRAAQLFDEESRKLYGDNYEAVGAAREIFENEWNLDDNWPGNGDLVEVLAENLSTYANEFSGDRHSQARELLRQFRATMGHGPSDYLELENWSRERLKRGRFLLFEGNKRQP